MKRFWILALCIFSILLCVTLVNAAEEYPFPTTPTQAITQANQSIDTAGYDETNKYFFSNNINGKAISPALSIGNWDTYRNAISYGTYKGNGVLDFGYALAYGQPYGFVSTCPRYLGQTMMGEPLDNPYFPMDSWAGGHLEDRVWIENPWTDPRSQDQCLDSTFDAPLLDDPAMYRELIIDGLDQFYHQILSGDYVNWHWENYVHVRQPPTYHSFGIGRMWHESGGHLWYLTVPIAPLSHISPPTPTPSPSPTPTPAAAPVGTIKFVPDSCTWRNTDLQVRVYVDGNTTTTENSSDSRDYSYSYLDCSISVHNHHSGCYNALGILICGITEHNHDSSCYSTGHSSTNWSYSQNWNIGQINVTGSPPLAATSNITNNTYVTVSQTGADELSAKLNGWNTGTKTWSSGSPPQGSWDADTPANTSAPTEDYASTSGTYHIDKVNPTITFNWSNQDDFRSGQHWFIYVPNNKINLTLGDNLSGIVESRYAWTQTSTFPATASMTNLGRTTTEGTAATVSTAIPIHDTQDRIGSWYLHVYASDRAGNIYTTSQPVYIECSLQNFRITDITDPQWENVFWNPSYASGVSTGAYYPVNQMPVDRHPTKNILPKKGYAFYFNMTSRGLNGDVDTVQIHPRFYYMKDLTTASILNAYVVDLYYDFDKEYLIQYGSSRDHFTMTYNKFNIGGLSDLILNSDVRNVTDSKNSTWNGRFALMPSTKAVRIGTPIVVNGKVDNSVILTKGMIMVNFTIEGYKNGIKVFDYNPAQWTDEGGPKDPALFYTGDTIIFDLTNSSKDDYGVGTDR